MENNLFQFIGKLVHLNRKRLWSLLWISALLSLGMSLGLPAYYCSQTTIFPVLLSSTPVNETLLKGSTPGDFGERREAEQAMELLGTRNLLERLVDRFDLIRHYDINAENPDAKSQAIKALEKNVDLKRTLRQSIEISVTDRNAAMAANLANAYAEQYDSLKFEIAQKRAKELLKPLEVQLIKQKEIVDSLHKLKEEWTSKGLMSSFQRAFFIQAYGSSSGKERSVMKDQLELNIAKGMIFDELEMRHDHELENLFTLNKFYVQIRSDAESILSQKFIIDKAEIPEESDRPIHILIVLATVFSALCFSIGLLLINSKGIEFWNSKIVDAI